MSRKDRRKLEKKRRKEQKRNRRKPAALAYHGSKYRNEKYVPLVFQTEAGIYEAFVMEDRKLTDHDVRRCLEELIRGFRSGREQFAAAPDIGGCDREAADDERDAPDFLTWNIRQHWQFYLEKHDPPARDDVVGVLRTILGCIETWGTMNPESRGYLHFLQDFMGEAGVHCEKVSGDTEIQVLDDDIEEDEIEGDEFLAAGLAWIHDSDRDAAKYFEEMAEEMIESGEGDDVGETCQVLMDECEDGDVCDKLGKLSAKAQEHRPAPRGPIRWALDHMLGR
jgi:hypothetical protein